MWLCLLAGVCTPASGQGQSALQGTVDGGASMLRQPGQPDVLAPSIVGALRLDAPRTALQASLATSRATAARAATQGALAGTHFFGAARTPQELGIAGSALRFNREPLTLAGVVQARQHLLLGAPGGRGGGGWVGALAGAAARRGLSAPVVGGDVGAWTGGARLSGSVSARLQRARLDSILPGNPVIGLPARRAVVEPLVALDLMGAVGWRAASVEVDASAGVRRAAAQADGVLGLATLSATWWVARPVGVTLAAGSLHADPLRGLPAFRYATLGLRWRAVDTRGARARRARRAEAAGVVAEVVTTRGRDAQPSAQPGAQQGTPQGPQRVLRVRAARARASVEVRADATGWRPLALARRGDAWEVVLPLEPGTQRLLLRIVGGEWLPPTNVPTVEDDFGTRVGLLVVP